MLCQMEVGMRLVRWDRQDKAANNCLGIARAQERAKLDRPVTTESIRDGNAISFCEDVRDFRQETVVVVNLDAFGALSIP